MASSSDFTQLKRSIGITTKQVREVFGLHFSQQLEYQADHDLGSHLHQSLLRLERYVENGGKLIRPWLVQQAFLIGQNQTESALSSDKVNQVAAAVELLHRYILNLDDMADRDELRYGHPTLEVAFRDQLQKANLPDINHHARSLSEIDGALLNSLAYELLNTSELPEELYRQVMSIVHHLTFMSTVAGWQMHYYQNFEPLVEADEVTFIRGLELVTAKYTFEAPLSIGLVLAGIGQADTLYKTLQKFSLEIGTAYQISDDILGLFGDTAETGKPVGNDVREGKKTLLLQKAYKLASPADQSILEQACGNRDLTDQQVEHVCQIVMETGAFAQVSRQLNQLVDQSIATVQSVPGSHTKLLVELAEFIRSRKK